MRLQQKKLLHILNYQHVKTIFPLILLFNQSNEIIFVNFIFIPKIEVEPNSFLNCDSISSNFLGFLYSGISDKFFVYFLNDLSNKFLILLFSSFVLFKITFSNSMLFSINFILFSKFKEIFSLFLRLKSIEQLKFTLFKPKLMKFSSFKISDFKLTLN